MYPETCVVSLERRTLPDEDASTTEAELREILDDIAHTDPGFRTPSPCGLLDHRPGSHLRDPVSSDVGRVGRE